MDLITGILIFVVVIVVVGIILYFISTINRLYRLRNSSDATLGQVRVALKKRLDMIEQLLGSVKSYANFEKETFERITSLRSAVSQTNVKGLGEVDSESRRIFGSIVAVAENYPTLRTSEPVSKLMDSVKDIEGEISRHRYTYNNIIQEYNIMLDTIPSKYVASSRGMTKREYLQFEEEIEKRPDIKF
jgi:LemA protein